MVHSILLSKPCIKLLGFRFPQLYPVELLVLLVRLAVTVGLLEL
jgi:hypothetical protein